MSPPKPPVTTRLCITFVIAGDFDEITIDVI